MTPPNSQASAEAETSESDIYYDFGEDEENSLEQAVVIGPRHSDAELEMTRHFMDPRADPSMLKDYPASDKRRC